MADSDITPYCTLGYARPVLKSIDTSALTVEAILTYPEIDYAGDFVKPDGGDWKSEDGYHPNVEHRRNNVVGKGTFKGLFPIDADGVTWQVPVGQTQFDAKDRLSAQTFRLVADEIMTGVSLEFEAVPGGYKSMGHPSPLERRDAMRFDKWIALGWAHTMQPANPHARTLLPGIEKAIKAVESGKLGNEFLDPLLLKSLASRIPSRPLTLSTMMKSKDASGHEHDPKDGQFTTMGAAHKSGHAHYLSRTTKPDAGHDKVAPHVAKSEEAAAAAEKHGTAEHHEAASQAHHAAAQAHGEQTRHSTGHDYISRQRHADAATSHTEAGKYHGEVAKRMRGENKSIFGEPPPPPTPKEVAGTPTANAAYDAAQAGADIAKAIRGWVEKSEHLDGKERLLKIADDFQAVAEEAAAIGNLIHADVAGELTGEKSLLIEPLTFGDDSLLVTKSAYKPRRFSFVGGELKAKPDAELTPDELEIAALLREADSDTRAASNTARRVTQTTRRGWGR